MEINTITNANVYIDGQTDLIGKIEKLTLPEITPTRESLAGLGAFGDPKVTTGLESLTMQLRWKSFFPAALENRLNIFTSTALQVRGNVETYGAGGRLSEDPAVMLSTVQFSKVMLGELERGKPITNMDDELTVERLELRVGATTYYRFDVFANIYEILGQDMLATFRANIGA